jgi:SAM-dependent methyltransferase
MDWAAHAGDGAAQYGDFLVPAVFAPFAEDLLDAAGVEPGAAVLDVASGTGAVSRAAARRAGASGRVTGVDLSAAMAVVADSVAREPGAAPIEYLVAPADELPVVPAAYDVALCQQGLQFFPDRVAALSAMRAALRPGGRLAVATWVLPDDTSPWTVLADAFDRHIGAEAAERMLSPYALSSGVDLRRAVEAAGFADVAVDTRTREVRFAERGELPLGVIKASPLAQTFADAPSEQQDAILASAADALSGYAGDGDEVRFPMTTNIATASRG